MEVETKIKMIIRDINIDKGSWLSEVMEEIPTNTILNKVMTGCGATTLEINAARHSIIIEPNVPVIIGKKAQHDFLFAVYEGTTREDVKAYLADVLEDYPQAERLIVPVERLSAFAAKVKTPGNIAHKYYNDIVSTMRGNKEV